MKLFSTLTLAAAMAIGFGTAYADSTQASVVWDFNSSTDYDSYTATPTDGFATIGFELNGNSVSGTETSKVVTDKTFVKILPATDYDDQIMWYVQPAEGYTFTPTSVSGYIGRSGTDKTVSGTIISAKVGDGEAITLGTYTAHRTNKTQEEDTNGTQEDYASQFNITLTAEQQEALVADGEAFYLISTIGSTSGKAGSFSDIHIEGLLTKTEEAAEDNVEITAVLVNNKSDETVYVVNPMYGITVEALQVDDMSLPINLRFYPDDVNIDVDQIKFVNWNTGDTYDVTYTTMYMSSSKYTLYRFSPTGLTASDITDGLWGLFIHTSAVSYGSSNIDTTGFYWQVGDVAVNTDVDQITLTLLNNNDGDVEAIEENEYACYEYSAESVSLPLEFMVDPADATVDTNKIYFITPTTRCNAVAEYDSEYNVWLISPAEEIEISGSLNLWLKKGAFTYTNSDESVVKSIEYDFFWTLPVDVPEANGEANVEPTYVYPDQSEAIDSDDEVFSMLMLMFSDQSFLYLNEDAKAASVVNVETGESVGVSFYLDNYSVGGPVVYVIFDETITTVGNYQVVIPQCTFINADGDYNPALTYYYAYGDSSGISDTVANGAELVDIYNIQGMCVAKQVKASVVNTLPQGIYIVNGKKLRVNN